MSAIRSSSPAAPSGPPSPMLLRTISTVSNRPSDGVDVGQRQRAGVADAAAARDLDGERRLVDRDDLATALLQQPAPRDRRRSRRRARGRGRTAASGARSPATAAADRGSRCRRRPDGAVLALHHLGGVTALEGGEQDRAVGVLVRGHRHRATLHAGTTESSLEPRSADLLLRGMQAARRRQDDRSGVPRSPSSLVGALIGIQQLTAAVSRGRGRPVGAPERRRREATLAGIPETKGVLGNPAAPATIRVYGDLRCPVCRSGTPPWRPT